MKIQSAPLKVKSFLILDAPAQVPMQLSSGSSPNSNSKPRQGQPSRYYRAEILNIWNVEKSRMDVDGTANLDDCSRAPGTNSVSNIIDATMSVLSELGRDGVVPADQFSIVLSLLGSRRLDERSMSALVEKYARANVGHWRTWLIDYERFILDSRLELIGRRVGTNGSQPPALSWIAQQKQRGRNGEEILWSQYVSAFRARHLKAAEWLMGTALKAVKLARCKHQVLRSLAGFAKKACAHDDLISLATKAVFQHAWHEQAKEWAISRVSRARRHVANRDEAYRWLISCGMKSVDDAIIGNVEATNFKKCWRLRYFKSRAFQWLKRVALFQTARYQLRLFNVQGLVAAGTRASTEACAKLGQLKACTDLANLALRRRITRRGALDRSPLADSSQAVSCNRVSMQAAEPRDASTAGTFKEGFGVCMVNNKSKYGAGGGCIARRCLRSSVFFIFSYVSVFV